MAFINRTCGIYTSFTVGFILTLLGTFTNIFWTPMYNRLVSDELAIRNGSTGYEMWKETPIPMYFTLHLYNWTNPKEVIGSKWSKKIELQECGPYTFSEHHIRVNVTWNNNGTVTYQQKRIWHFLPEKSNGTLHDQITLLNPIIAFVGHALKDKSLFIKVLANIALREFEKDMFITKPVNELLFDGYEDKLLRIINKLNISSLHIPFDKFGWFYNRNGSATFDGIFNMYTGTDNIDLLGLMHQWNGMPATNDYYSYCSYVNGTSGELWPPIHNYKIVSIFSPDTCSSLALNLAGEEAVHGVSGQKYLGTDYMFDNGSKYPEQSCFKDPKQYLPSGVRDLSKCKFNAPVFMSFPHFYLADESYLSRLQGLRPNKTLHEMYIALEPATGVPLDVQARLQVNLMIEPIDGMPIFNGVKKTYMPILWFAQSAVLTEKYADLVKKLLILPHVGFYTGWGVFAFGLLFISIGLYVTYAYDRRDNDTEELITETK